MKTWDWVFWRIGKSTSKGYKGTVIRTKQGQWKHVIGHYFFRVNNIDYSKHEYS